METATIGKAGPKVSRVGLGTLAFGHKSKGIQDRKAIRECINLALDGGINLIDTAEEYAGGLTESIIGETLRERGGREDVVLVTKVSHDHLKYGDVLKAAERSLERLQTDYIDIYLVHWPWCYVPVSETMMAMEKLLAEGMIRHVGLSNFPNALVREAADCLESGEIVLNELEYNLINRDVEKELLPFLKGRGMSLLAYYPLMGGFLTAKYDEKTAFPENDFRNHWELFKNKDNFARARELFAAMREIADAHDASPAEVAINWLLTKGGVIPIPGAKSIGQVECNIHAAQWTMTADEARRLTSLTDNLQLNWDRF